MNRTRKAVSHRLAALACFLFSCSFAHADTFYVSNWGDNTISKIDSSGRTTLFASTGLHPFAVALDNSGNLYVTDSAGIEKFDSNGSGTLFSSFGGTFFGMAFGSNGNLYLADNTYNQVGQMSSSGQPVPSPVFTVDSPTGLAFDSSGNLYVAASRNNWIVKISPAGQMSGFARTGLNQPYGLAFDKSGNLYAANAGNNTIEKFDSSGNGTLFFSTYSSPSGLAFDSSGNLHVVEQRALEMVDPNGHGNFWPESSFNQPAGIAVQVPEPATGALLALGLAALLGIHRLRPHSS